MTRLLKRKQLDNAFLGFVQMVKEEIVAEKYKGKSDLGAVHVWREDLPSEIKAVLDEYEDVFQRTCHPDFHPYARAKSSRLSSKMMRPQRTKCFTS